MFESEVLEIGIGLAFLFLFVSLLCSAACEAIESIFKARAKDMERGLRELLHDPDGNTIMQSFCDHPLIFPLFSGHYDPEHLKISQTWTGLGKRKHMPFSKRRNLPSYIPAELFATALLDIIARGRQGTQPIIAFGEAPSVASVRASIYTLPNLMLQRAVLTALDYAGDDLACAKKNLEIWFNGTMDRVSGWYRRRTQMRLFLLGFLGAAAFNIDTITIAQHLTTDKTLREAIVAQAEAISVKGNEGKDAPVVSLQAKPIIELQRDLKEIGVPFGWDNGHPAPQTKCLTRDSKGFCVKRAALSGDMILQIILGWLITAVATMLGAPFWFDVLNKIMIVRSTVKPHEKSLKEAWGDQKPNVVGSALSSPIADSATGAEITFTPHEWRPGHTNPNEAPL